MTQIVNQEYFESFGERISQQRREIGMRQADLAEALGCSQPMMAHYEAGRRRFPLSMLVPLAKELKVSTTILLGEEIQNIAKKSGRPHKLEIQLDRLKNLPRAKQKLVMEVIEGLLQRYQAS